MMMMRPFILFFVYLLFLFFSHQGQLCVGFPGIQFIQETCNKSTQIDPVLSYDFCLTSLWAVPESHTADLRGLGFISLKLATTNATHTKYRVRKLNHQTRDRFTKECLKTCLEVYSDAITALKDSIKAFKYNNFEDVDTFVSATMSDAETCEDGFKEKKGLVSPLTKENTNLFQLCAMALAITHLA
ncbi:putative invertase inhibitor [Magnolia sinica]|uniref:putative invertase inhibitor n=1 Tax=Magnolia sinica TaxID=86752 RepID=UPI00265AABD8|nr:putative invertase inhibitor [Magnolia sinica]